MADPKRSEGRSRSAATDWVAQVSGGVALELIDAAVIVTDPDGSIVYWNGAAEELYRWPAYEAIGRNFLKLVASDGNADPAASDIERALAGERWRGEFPARRGDGTTFIALVTVEPSIGEEDRVVSLVVVSLDVTTARQTSADLEASLHRFQALVRASGELFIIVDAEGLITFIDGPVRARLGMEPESLLGRSALSLFTGRDLERARAVLDRRLSTTTMLPPEDFWLERPDGTWRCESLVMNNLLDDPAISGIVVTARDVTEPRNIERARFAVSGATTALVRATNEGDLFDQLCRIVVNDVTYHLAWIGVTDPTRPLGVRMVAFADHSAKYVDALEALTGSEFYGGPMAIAIQTRKMYVAQDLATLPEAPWQRLALDYGYRSLIALPLYLAETDFGVLAIYSEHANAFAPDAVSVLTALAEDLSYGIDALRIRAEGADYRARFEGSLEATVRAMATAAELRDPYTAGHQRRVAELAGAIATELGLDAELVAGVQVAATIHDIGKLAVPSDILTRPGRLSDAEFALIKVHPQAGHDIIAGIEFPWPVADVILQHHERLDGSGYPRGLHGEEVSMGARVVAVADTVEAIISHRPYRPALGFDKALEVIRSGRGSLFDPDVVDACCRLLEEQGFSFAL